MPFSDRLMTLRWVFAIASVGFLITGCSSQTDSTNTAEPYAASGGIADQQVPSLPEEPSSEFGSNVPSGTVTGTSDSAGRPAGVMQPPRGESQQSPFSQPSPSPNSPLQPASAQARPGGLQLDTGEELDTASGPNRGLRADLTPEQLVKFLATADSDMQTIVSGQSGIRDQEEARSVLIQIVKMKLEASRRLAASEASTEAMQSEGRRGELQSLSHLASLGDLPSAEALEQLAERHLSSDDPKLVSDSRLVLIGFAIEQLQNGDEQAPAKILKYVGEIAKSETSPGVPAMMVMGQARAVLASYGHDVQAKQVRDTIIDLFADSPEAPIAQMASQLAGNVRFDKIDEFLEKAIQGEGVTVETWREAAETLIDESPDLQTVQYLAGTALDFESSDRDDLAQSTYDVLATRFDDPASATGNEALVAIRAREARQRVIGRLFDPDLPSLDGAPIRIEDYREKVVLMPFWATSFPESLQVLGKLNALKDEFPDRVAIIGMNLDVQGVAVQEFAERNELGFPSFRAETSVGESISNPVASQFGLVSMPFVAIVDGDGRVVELDFSGRQIEKTVKSLIDR